MIELENPAPLEKSSARRFSRERWVVALLLVAITVVAALRLRYVTLQFPHLIFGDELYATDITFQLAQGNFLYHLNPPTFRDYPYAAFFIHSFIWRLVQGFSLGEGHTAELFLLRLTEIARLVNILAGVGLALVTFEIGRRYYGVWVGLGAAALGLFSYFYVFGIIWAKGDSLTAFFFAVTLLFVLGVSEHGPAKPRFYYLAGLFAGLTFGSKYSSLIILVALPLAHLVYTLYAKGSWRQIFFNKHLVGGMAVCVAIFLITTPYSLSDPGLYWDGFLHRIILGGAVSVDPLPPLAFPLGYLEVIVNGLNQYYNDAGFSLGDPATWNFGLLTPLLCLAGLVWAFIKRTKPDIIIGLLLLCSLGIVFRSFTSFRYGHFVPEAMLAQLLAVRVVADFTGWVIKKLPAPSFYGWGVRLMAFGLVAGLVIWPYPDFKQTFDKLETDYYSAQLERVYQIIPPGAKIFSEEYTPKILSDYYDSYIQFSVSFMTYPQLIENGFNYVLVSEQHIGGFEVKGVNVPTYPEVYKDVVRNAKLIEKVEGFSLQGAFYIYELPNQPLKAPDPVYAATARMLSDPSAPPVFQPNRQGEQAVYFPVANLGPSASIKLKSPFATPIQVEVSGAILDGEEFFRRTFTLNPGQDLPLDLRRLATQVGADWSWIKFIKVKALDKQPGPTLEIGR